MRSDIIYVDAVCDGQFAVQYFRHRDRNVGAEKETRLPGTGFTGLARNLAILTIVLNLRSCLRSKRHILMKRNIEE